MTDSATIRPLEAPAPASSAKTCVDIWSTDAVGARERFSYWRDAVCHAVFGISAEAPPDQFSACITARSSGPLRFARSESTRYWIARDRRDISAAPSDHYSIYLQLGGRTVASMGDQTFEFDAGDVGLLDGRQPFRAFHGGRRAIGVLPRAIVARRAPWLLRSPPRKLSANSPYMDLIRRHLLTLSAPDLALGEAATSVLTDNLCNLVALGTAGEIEPGRLQPELQIEALLAFCRQNLHDAELSPQLAADHFRISLRTLHLRFSQVGQTFGRWVLDNRLEACASALRDGNQRRSNISEIAYRWGFNDLSHFNKAFRARFGTTPGEWRNTPVNLKESPPTLCETCETPLP
jgi:AraC-like DNA-binding protein